MTPAERLRASVEHSLYPWIDPDVHEIAVNAVVADLRTVFANEGREALVDLIYEVLVAHGCAHTDRHDAEAVVARMLDA